MELTTHLLKNKGFYNQIKILYPLCGVQPNLENNKAQIITNYFDMSKPLSVLVKLKIIDCCIGLSISIKLGRKAKISILSIFYILLTTFLVTYFGFAKPKWNSLPYQSESFLALYNSFCETKELLSQRTIIPDFITKGKLCFHPSQTW